LIVLVAYDHPSWPVSAIRPDAMVIAASLTKLQQLSMIVSLVPERLSKFARSQCAQMISSHSR
jgi:hypothetical protein